MIGVLLPELIILIFQKCSVDDLAKISRTCKSLNSLAKHVTVWRSLLQKEYLVNASIFSLGSQLRTKLQLGSNMHPKRIFQACTRLSQSPFTSDQLLERVCVESTRTLPNYKWGCAKGIWMNFSASGNLNYTDSIRVSFRWTHQTLDIAQFTKVTSISSPLL